MTKKWWQQSVVYQIYPKSFYDSNNDGVGDLKGVIQKLDYLKELGIDVIWLSPVYQSPMDDNGYDISDYQQIAEEFGSMEDMDLLIKEADQRNIKIIMDLVVNHTSDEHQWFLDSKSDRHHPKRDWYIWRDGEENGAYPNNWRSIFGGSCWEYDEQTKQYYLHTFSKKQPDLNWENPEVREHVYRMIHWWLEKGIGGFRVDAITFIKKREDYSDVATVSADGLGSINEASLNQEGIDHFLTELNEKVFSNYDILTVAEAPGVSVEQLPNYVGNDGYFNMLFEFDHVDLDLGAEGKWFQPYNWELTDFKRAISKSQNLFNETGWGALYLENHDQPRSLNKFIAEKDIGMIPAKMLAAVYFLLKGTPFIYQGQEIGMTNVSYSSIDDYDDLASIDQYQTALTEGYSEEDALSAIWNRSRDNARTPMQWSETIHAGFSNVEPWLKTNPNYPVINVEAALENQDSLFYFYKELIRLRKDSEYSDVIVYGKYEAILEDHPQIIAYSRKSATKQILVIANFQVEPVPLTLDYQVKSVVLSNYDNLHRTDKDIILQPFEVLVCEVELDG